MPRDIQDWLDEVGRSGYIWYVKRLSGNDTLANGSHQAGPYIPRDVLLRLFPSLNRPDLKNPDLRIEFSIDSHEDKRIIRIIWYNNKLHGGTRNESRLTNFGGMESPLLDPENTGALTVFAFEVDGNGAATSCRIWVCRDEHEETLVEDRVGPVEPGTWTLWQGGAITLPLSDKSLSRGKETCWLDAADIPPEWMKKFPSGLEIIKRVIEFRPASEKSPDSRLLQRRNCEFEMFRSLEEAIELPAIRKGFASIDDFMEKAQTILQRRKARSGRSLELHMKEIFIEEGLKEGKDFSHQPQSESGKKPDFLFPSEGSYRDTGYAREKLRMLAVKTTCKDRWRQILNEADRIGEKHLLTLQEGISENQYREMVGAGVKLVVPKPLIESYPKKIQNQLLTVESFLSEVRNLGV